MTDNEKKQAEAITAKKSLLRSESGNPKYLEFRPSNLPMLSAAGTFPSRLSESHTDSQWAERSVQDVPPWLDDWEKSLSESGWTVIRKLNFGATEGLPWEAMDPAFPEDADLFCPRRKIYLALVPESALEENEVCFTAMTSGYPGSLVIVRSGACPECAERSKESGAIPRLLSPDSRKTSVHYGALVEHDGVLYEAEGDDLWIPTQNLHALEIYYEYRCQSEYYGKEQVQRDRNYVEQLAKDFKIIK